MNWFIEVFSSSSDQARAITALFVAGMAIAAILINQAFLSRRARKEKLIEKIEEFYSEASAAEAAIDDVHVQIISSERFGVDVPGAVKSHSDAMEKLRSCKKLASLYFKELSNEVKSLQSAYVELHVAYVSAETVSEYMDAKKHFHSEIEDRFSALYAELNTIMKKVMH